MGHFSIYPCGSKKHFFLFFMLIIPFSTSLWILNYMVYGSKYRWPINHLRIPQRESEVYEITHNTDLYNYVYIYFRLNYISTCKDNCRVKNEFSPITSSALRVHVLTTALRLSVTSNRNGILKSWSTIRGYLVSVTPNPTNSQSPDSIPAAMWWWLGWPLFKVPYENTRCMLRVNVSSLCPIGVLISS